MLSATAYPHKIPHSLYGSHDTDPMSWSERATCMQQRAIPHLQFHVGVHTSSRNRAHVPEVGGFGHPDALIAPKSIVGHLKTSKAGQIVRSRLPQRAAP